MTYTFPQLLLSVMTAIYVAVSVVVAVVRWGHRCTAYAKHMDYYFPDWRAFIFCFLSNLVLLPVVFLPNESDAIMQLRLMLILASPFHCAVLIFNYFGRILKANWWHGPIYILMGTYSMMAIIGVVTTLMPGTQVQGDFFRWFFIIADILAMAYLVSFVLALLMLIRELTRFSDENYSNPDDFPKQYTEFILLISVLHLIMSWSMAINGQWWALSFGLFVLSILAVVLLLGSLSPHRTVEVDQLEAAMSIEKDKSLESEVLSPDKKEEILTAIRQQVEEKQGYLDSHLTLNKLSRDCGLNRTYVSWVLNERLGGFFFYINRCRMAHADNYKAAHPDADVDDIALASGFNNRQSYYNARKRVAA